MRGIHPVWQWLDGWRVGEQGEFQGKRRDLKGQYRSGCPGSSLRIILLDKRLVLGCQVGIGRFRGMEARVQ